MVGGGAAVAVTVAVGSIIGLTSAAALADRAGTPLANAAIVVHGVTAPVASSALVADAKIGPVTVPAPDAQEVSPSVDTGRTGGPAAGSDSTHQKAPAAHSSRTGSSKNPAPPRKGSRDDHDKRHRGKDGPGQPGPGQDEPGPGQDEQGAVPDHAVPGGDDNAQDLLRDAEDWRTSFSTRLQSLYQQVQDSAEEAVKTSVQVHPRTWIGWQEQSSRSPDSGD